MSQDKKSEQDGMKEISRVMTVNNQYGIHARPAALFVKTANQYVSEIKVGHKGLEVSAKSIMGLLTIEGHQGAELTVTAQGSDALEALEAIEELFRQNFLEE